MSTPSERLFARAPGDDDELAVADFLPARPRCPMTLAETARRIDSGVALREAVADFVDDLRWARDDQDLRARIDERPVDLDARTDAYLAALAEHAAAARDLPAPGWTLENARFLDRIWWPRYEGLWARAIVESPAAFRRRGIFLGAGMLQRV